MICGASNFSSVEDDFPWSPKSTSTPRKSSKRGDKNPYSNRGLDKFATVVSDLEVQKEKIMEKVADPEAVMIRFTHSPSHGWVPIIVKVGESKPKQGVKSVVGRGEEGNSKVVAKSSSVVSEAKEKSPAAVSVSESRMKKSSSWNANRDGRKTSCYFPVVLILMLVCLVMFGRSFAILSTSIWWYLVPTIRSGDANVRRALKMENGRRLDEMGGEAKSHQLKISSPRHHLHHHHHLYERR